MQKIIMRKKEDMVYQSKIEAIFEKHIFSELMFDLLKPDKLIINFLLAARLVLNNGRIIGWFRVVIGHVLSELI